MQSADNPWQISFQMNERHLTWEDAAARRMIKLWVAEKLGESVEDVEARMLQLVTLLPDMLLKLERIKADIVLQLVQDPEAVAKKLIRLREALPNTDISKLVARSPAVLLELTPATVAARVSQLRLFLPRDKDAEELIHREPALLFISLDTVVRDIRRLMPTADPRTVLWASPTSVLDMAAHRMESSEETPTKFPLGS